MFQVEADVRFTWLQIGRKALRLTASWLHFFGWRIATVVPECLTVSFLKQALSPRRRPGGAGSMRHRSRKRHQPL